MAAAKPAAAKPAMAAKSTDCVEVTYFNVGHGRASPIEFLLEHSGTNWKKENQT